MSTYKMTKKLDNALRQLRNAKGARAQIKALKAVRDAYNYHRGLKRAQWITSSVNAQEDCKEVWLSSPVMNEIIGTIFNGGFCTFRASSEYNIEEMGIEHDTARVGCWFSTTTDINMWLVGELDFYNFQLVEEIAVLDLLQDIAISALYRAEVESVIY